ncbi:MAG TPA: hypothetical protein DHU55_13835 [Blastocatellia bacterium]|jgi:uncharacterized protein YuzE|nr:hypothetical protein [Blastocatellia bacterium]
MKLTVDPEADALYLRLNDAEIADSEQVASGVVLDYDAQDNVVGVEMLHLSKRAQKADLQRLLFETLGASIPEELIMRETAPPYGKEKA